VFVRRCDRLQRKGERLRREVAVQRHCVGLCGVCSCALRFVGWCSAVLAIAAVVGAGWGPCTVATRVRGRLGRGARRAAWRAAGGRRRVRPVTVRSYAARETHRRGGTPRGMLTNKLVTQTRHKTE
jgi:hypothetical protein